MIGAVSMNDTISVGFSPPRKTAAGGQPWEGAPTSAAPAPGPAPAALVRLGPSRGRVEVAGRRSAAAGPLTLLGCAAGGDDL
ncbi:hypothetical protein [Streptomyces angustmyceticus]|uniref:hypothetical protein n=1 Tax=Streptomyces angustmyceticus TaxID=285578 RepID=UPI0021AFD974|nr:hypothetical protein [Streptomyces angustmyceticus]